MSLILEGYGDSNLIITDGFGDSITEIFPVFKPNLISAKKSDLGVVSGEIIRPSGIIGSRGTGRPKPVKGPTPTKVLFEMFKTWLRGVVYAN